MLTTRGLFFIIKPTRCTNFTNLFCHETLHVSDSFSVHHQEFIHCAFSNGICHTAFEQDQDGTAVPSWSCSKAVWHIPLLSAQWINSWWWTDELSETCRVSCQNKFVKLVHLVGFIIKKICYNARSHERKKNNNKDLCYEKRLPVSCGCRRKTKRNAIQCHK